MKGSDNHHLAPEYRASRSSAPVLVRAAVACSLVLAVVASIGLAGTPALAETTPAWTVTPTPNALGSNSLNSVSCVSATFCTAVGSYKASPKSKSRNLIEAWNGRTWTVVPSPDRGNGNNSLDGVSCASADHCVAVGSGYGPVYEEGVILSYNGRFWKVTSTLRSDHGIYAFAGVSCLNADFCVAVGHAANDAGTLSIIDMWNGSRWSVKSSTLNLTMTGVSCSSTQFCAAVGNEPGNPYSDGVIYLYQKSKWAQSSVVSGSHAEYTLSGVSCASTRSCEAVGHVGDDAGILTFIDTWDGSTWSEPSSGTILDAALTGVSCADRNDCVAAGYSNIDSRAKTNLIESWNGKSWATDSTPDRGSRTNKLYGVSCPGSYCGAVGFFVKGSLHETLALVD